MDFDDLELDLPPEYCHYQDNGCEFADSCLDCPFPDCLYDQPRGKQRWLKALRNEAVLRLFSDQAKRVKELALMFGVSRRTIQRILKQASISTPKIKTLGEADG
jgi:transcriptional regulator of acetoin/glycerol metabolism